MNKTRLKQIYLLTVIIGGILTLSVYSTYSIFTLESETSDIVSIHTPNSLEIATNTYEYRQIKIPKNSSVTIDADLYNSFDYELCYSVWYKVVSTDIDADKINLLQNTNEDITTSGTIESLDSKRISLVLTNDDEKDAIINTGVAFNKNGDTCELNISTDKNLVTDTLYNPQDLSKTIISTDNKKTEEEGYLTYKDRTDKILLNNEYINISKKYAYHKEIFTLEEPEEVELDKISEYISKDGEYYTCINTETCQTLYKITEVVKEDNKYYISKYDLMKGYLAGESGLRKIDDDYVYYGDNPHNFVYYNCTNNKCELWRIIGFIYDKENDKYFTKIIKDESIDDYQIYDNSSNLWKDSSLEKYLNKEYELNNLPSMKDIKFKQENVIDLSSPISHMDDEIENSVTIMNITDYMNASICEDKKISEFDTECINSNWLNTGINEWTMTTKFETVTEEPIEEPEEETEDEEEEEQEVVVPKPINVTAYSIDGTIKESNINTKLAVRPIVYLSGRTFMLSGDGTLEKPYIIK